MVHMVDPLERLERVFRALADRTRLRILARISGGEVCVCEIHGSLGLPQPTVSRHLAYLRNTGLVVGRKEGLWVHYRLAQPDDPVERAVLEAAAHWAHHVPSVERDTERLEKRTGRTSRSMKVRVLGCCGR